ncbi:energy transducer TonB [Shewanella marina]|uniref:energy transducer TonB n=1 Tax=Shewanella marina TaxID=487319 RepID=UPI000472A26E|nr:energy transducer TonB [Shewanella marina]
MWPLQPIIPTKNRGVIMTVSLLINLLLAAIIYRLTLSDIHAPAAKIQLTQVYFSDPISKPLDEPQTATTLTNAPLTSSPPPPPMKLTINPVNIDSQIVITTPEFATPDSISEIQAPTLNFSQVGITPGSQIQANLAMAQVSFQTPPQYPLRAKQRGIEGRVSLKLLISTEGRVKQVELIEEHPQGVFYRSAARAVLRWRFVPPQQDEWQQVIIAYELEK